MTNLNNLPTDSIICESARSLADIPQALIQVLPPELLSTVFRLGLRELDRKLGWYHHNRHVPYPHIQVLAAVCVAWRQIIWTTPSFWTHICIYFRQTNIQKRALLFRLFLENSQDLLIDLDLAFSSHLCIENLIHPSVDGPVVGALYRVRSITLKNSPSISAWLSHATSLSSLTKLSLRPSARKSPTIIHLSEISSLSILDLQSIPCTSIILPWRSINILTLNNLPLVICVQLLLQCPDLEYCALGQDTSSSDLPGMPTDMPTGPQASVSKYKLRTLQWDYSGDEWDDFLFQRLHVPILNRALFRAMTESSATFATFLRRLPTTLETISISSPSWGNLLLSLLPPDLGVHSMATGSYPGKPLSDAVTKNLQHKESPYPHWPFPRLQLLVLGHWAVGAERLSKEESFELITTLASRAAALNRTMILHLFNLKLTWNTTTHPNSLVGGDKMVIREGEEGAVPAWYQSLVPGIQEVSDAVGRKEEAHSLLYFLD
ncbi:hypothetical protein NP233_g9192 [Leucocoprinus birnbaumii]|uniref:F-box domain-containing protein n=1 Tax=Leucocoprinus birnbaumii TaxID=56174 RepID=A0AAD5YMF9_9AGAR|nr:hypothetical protein NP233_g9192 [Leucocoprinus birnbaumii]